MATTHHDNIAFIGGGNMASAIIGGLLKRGAPASSIQVVEPLDEQRQRLKAQFGVQLHAAPNVQLASATLVVWAIKPQIFKDAALQTRFHTKTALHLSVAAGITSSSIARWLDTDHVVRAMYFPCRNLAETLRLIRFYSFSASGFDRFVAAFTQRAIFRFIARNFQTYKGNARNADIRRAV